MGQNKNKSSKSNEKLKGKGRGKVTSSKTPPTAETEAPQPGPPHSDEEREEVMQVEVQEPQNSETEDHEEEDLQKMKKVKVPDSLTAAQEQALVEWFGEHPIFFDQSERDFKNKSKRDRMLAEKAKEFDITGTDLAIWFKSQRSIFGRLKRKKSGQANTSQTSRQKWVMENFSFLKAHIVVRSDSRQLGTVGIPKQSQAEEEQEEDDDISPSDPSTQESANLVGVPESCGVGLSQCSQSSQRLGKVGQARKRRQVDEAILTLVERAASTTKLQEQVDEALTATSNPRTAWANWMGTELQDLPQHLWTLYQKESFALVMRYKEDAQAQQAQQAQLPQQPQQPQLAPSYPPRPASVPLASTSTSTMPQEWYRSQQPSGFQQQQQPFQPFQPPHPPIATSSGLTPTQAPQPLGSGTGLTPLLDLSWSGVGGQDLSFTQMLGNTQPTTESDRQSVVRRALELPAENETQG